MSAIIANSQPPPRAKPLTAAIIGLRILGMVEDQSEMKLVLYAWLNVRSFISLMSAPAFVGMSNQRTGLTCGTWTCIPANAFSLPVSTMAPVVLSSSNFRSASFNSTKTADERALRALGRLRVTD